MTKLLSANEPAIWEGHFCLSDLPQGKRVDEIAEKRCAIDEHAKWINEVTMGLRPVVPEDSVAYAHSRNCANGSAEPVLKRRSVHRVAIADGQSGTYVDGRRRWPKYVRPVVSA